MTIVEVLKDPRFVAGQLWSRPVTGWIAGRAMTAEMLRDYPRTTLDVRDVLSDWELVAPEAVRGERKAWSREGRGL